MRRSAGGRSGCRPGRKAERSVSRRGIRRVAAGYPRGRAIDPIRRQRADHQQVETDDDGHVDDRACVPHRGRSDRGCRPRGKPMAPGADSTRRMPTPDVAFWTKAVAATNTPRSAAGRNLAVLGHVGTIDEMRMLVMMMSVIENQVHGQSVGRSAVRLVRREPAEQAEHHRQRRRPSPSVRSDGRRFLPRRRESTGAVVPATTAARNPRGRRSRSPTT